MTPSDEPAALPDTLALIERVVSSSEATAADLFALVESLGDARRLVQRRAVDALAVLGTRGLDVRSPLLAALQSPTAGQRWGAAFALARLGSLPPEALPVLVQALGAADGDVRWAAAEVVSQSAGRAGLPDTLRDLVQAGNPQQRKMAAYCLRDIGASSTETEAALLTALHDPDTGVRLAAISSVARLATHRVRVAEHLTRLLEDAEARIRRASAVALGELGERSEPVLIALHRAAASRDVSLQRAAERSLRVLEA